MPNDFTARSWPAACPLAVSPPLSSLLALLLSLACFTHSQTAPYTLIYARTSCQNVFCCPRLQRFQFALTSRPGSQTLLPACLPDCQSVWPGLACSAVCLLEPITSAPCLPALPSQSSSAFGANPFVVVRRQADGARIRCCHCHGLPLRHAILLI